jgi:hypothetical protein
MPASARQAMALGSMWIFGLPQRTYHLAQVVAAMSFIDGCLVEGPGAGDRHSRVAVLAMVHGADVDQPIGGGGCPR